MKRSPWWQVLCLADSPEQVSLDAISDDRIDLIRALQRLPREHRLTLALRYYLDLPIDEVVGVLGISVSAAKSGIRRALKALEPVASSEPA
jgi:DNA-directed RNA polymerase specialized sigma24 family protein